MLPTAMYMEDYSSKRQARLTTSVVKVITPILDPRVFVPMLTPVTFAIFVIVGVGRPLKAPEVHPPPPPTLSELLS